MQDAKENREKKMAPRTRSSHGHFFLSFLLRTREWCKWGGGGRVVFLLSCFSFVLQDQLTHWGSELREHVLAPFMPDWAILLIKLTHINRNYELAPVVWRLWFFFCIIPAVLMLILYSFFKIVTLIESLGYSWSQFLPKYLALNLTVNKYLFSELSLSYSFLW